MGAWMCLLVLAVALLQNDLARAVVPLLCSSSVCQINPTLNTITLEKPFCFFTPLSPARVALFVVKTSSADWNIALTNYYRNTSGGSTAPYVADKFANPSCPPNLSIADVSTYVYRVGTNDSCLSTTICNGPLASNTAYSFKYVFFNSIDKYLDESEWSAPITTKQGKSPANIDTWPGRRSGGMIVLTSILSVLTFLVLAGLVAAVITNIMTPMKQLEPTRHESRSTHNVAQKPEVGESSVGVSEH
ncbi:uroplakin-3a [Bufo bufo]|uniref:uroplakin-3a n=1 Tax=Bufo bufo TaxID=8384 RepID=UPI001ABE2676|nr:uroplakin-3a [Bufo bufo]